MNLDEQLKALKDDEGRIEVPPRVEARLLEAFDAQRPTIARRRLVRRFAVSWPVAASLAAGVLIGAVLTLWQLPHGPDEPTLAATPISESVVLVLEPPGVQETVRVVRIRVARSALESLGIQTMAAQGSDSGLSGSALADSVLADTVLADSVEVDVLVGEDGVARGVRLAM